MTESLRSKLYKGHSPFQKRSADTPRNKRGKDDDGLDKLDDTYGIERFACFGFDFDLPGAIRVRALQNPIHSTKLIVSNRICVQDSGFQTRPDLSQIKILEVKPGLNLDDGICRF